MKAAFILCSAALLMACGEKPQEIKGVRTDKSPYSGTGVTSFTEAGWKVGDKDSWANHLKARATYGQNDHVRAPK